MAGFQDPTTGPADRALARDAALFRITRVRRWMLAGAAALTAGLAALASALLPGKSLGAGSHGSVETAAATSAVTPPLPAAANAAQLGISAPGQAPQSLPPPPTPQPAPQPSQPQPAPSGGGGGAVVSGGS
jgi:hypothetical protein